MTKNPKVSIIIPVYNGSNYLKEAIESALNQTYKNIEVIVVNDGSTDDGATKRVALSFGSDIKYIEKENGGVATALNFGIQHATGEYVSWLSHDDMYCSTKIEEEVKAIKKEKDIIACNITTIDSDGNKIKDFKIPNMFKKSIKTFLAMSPDVGLNGCSLLIPKAIFEQVGWFKKELKYTQDYDMWFRMSDYANFRLLDKNLVLSRQHAEQDSVKKNDVCTLDSDKLHAQFLSVISTSELMEAIDYNVEKVSSYITIYYVNHYIRTAAYLIKHLTEYYLQTEKEKEAKELLNKFLFKLEKADDIILPEGEHTPNIMFYSNAWMRGGIERVLSILLEDLKSKYHLFLVTPYIKENQGYKIPDGITHLLIGNEAEQAVNFTNLCIALIYHIDIFVGNPNIIDKFFDSYILLKECNVRTMAVNHYYYFLPYTQEWIYPIIKKRKEVYQDVDVVAWLTPFNLDIYSSLYHNGVLLENPAPFSLQKRDQEDDKKIILCVGRFYDNIKRIDRMLQIFERVLLDVPDAKLWLVGPYDMNVKLSSLQGKTLQEYFDDMNLPKDQVVFWGDQENIIDFYKKASLLLMTSESEGFPLALLEAITCSLPCVLGKIPGLDILLENEVNGFIEEQDDYVQLAKDVVKILKDQKLAKRFSDESYKKAQKFQRANVAKAYGKIFDVLLSDNYKEKLVKEVYMPVSSQYIHREVIKEYELKIPNLVDTVINKQKDIDILLDAVSQQNQVIADLNARLAMGTNFEATGSRSSIVDDIKHLLKRIIKALFRRIKAFFRKVKTFTKLLFTNPKKLIVTIKEKFYRK